ncbi:NAD-dependent epimerase/dehydratase family protein [Thioclava sp.]|uniref:NAD-dependent epimerase/dehydratase family protein n=1 Tax=Thioclava sp. TaxID=1933450 RepID=UPI003AA7F50D
MSGVFVTGGTGFVGRHVCRLLAAVGQEVTAIVRPGSVARVPEGIARVIVVEDIFTQTPEWWAEHLTEGAHLIHLAWTATPGKYINDPANLRCLAGTLAMAEGAIAAGISKITGIGTCIEYRMGDAPLDIDTPLDPQSPYAGAKAAAFTALSTSLAKTDTDFAWCRLFALHGEGEHPGRLVANLHSRLANGQEIPLSDGAQIRDFLDVKEAAQRIVTTALGPTNGPVNICSGTGISVRDLALGIATQYGRVDLLKFGARPNNIFDPATIVGVPTKMPKDFAP